MEENLTSSMTLRDYLRVLFRQKAVVITSFVTVMVTVFIGLKFKTPVYEAQTKILISGQKQTESLFYREVMGLRSGELALTQAEIITSGPVIERAVRATGLYARDLDYEKKFASSLKRPFIERRAKAYLKRIASLTEDQKRMLLARMAIEDLKAHIKVEPVRDTNIVTIKVRDFSPVGAAILANVVSRSYLIFDLEQQLAELALKYGEKHQAYIQLKDYIDRTTQNLTGEPLPNIEAIGPASVKVIEQAQVPLEPVGPPEILILILAFFMAIFLGVMLAFAFEYMDQTFKSPQEVESFLKLPYLGSVPANSTLQNFRLLSDQIYLILKDKGWSTLSFVATLPREGVTTIVSNMGTYLAKTAGHRVLIVDANFRNPGVYRQPKSSDVVGLAELIEGKTTLDKAVKDVGENLHILAAGKTSLNPITLLSSLKMQELIRQLRQIYEVVLFDLPPLRDFKDAAIVAALTDATAVVVNEGKTRKQVVAAALESLRAEKGVNIIGVVLNNRVYAIPSFIYKRI